MMFGVCVMLCIMVFVLCSVGIVFGDVNDVILIFV